MQRREQPAGAGASDGPSALARAEGSPSSSLPDPIRGQMESTLGVDLRGVRLHADEPSATAASAIGAQAYTVGQDIHFGSGRFDLSSADGQHLVAHEVAHTVQQRDGGEHVSTKADSLETSQPGDSAELEADAAADAMLAGQPARVQPTSLRVHRFGAYRRLGNKAAHGYQLDPIDLGEGIFLYFGDLVMLGGDLFGSWQEIEEKAAGEAGGS